MNLLPGTRWEERATLAVSPASDTAHAVYRWWGWELRQVPATSGEYFEADDLFVIVLEDQARRR